MTKEKAAQYRHRYKTYYKKNSETRIQDARLYRLKYPERFKLYHRKWRMKVRRQMFDAYGGKCACCFETREAFLTVDHINGGGSKARKLHGFGVPFYLKLRRLGWPQEGLRILCMNCNFAIRYGEICPHEK